MQMQPSHLGRGIADRSVRDHHVRRQAAPLNGRTSAQRFCVLTILPPVYRTRGWATRAAAIAQRFRALTQCGHSHAVDMLVALVDKRGALLSQSRQLF